MQEEKDTACVLEEIKNAALSGGLKVMKVNIPASVSQLSGVRKPRFRF